MPTEQDWSDDRTLFADGRVADLGPLSGEFVRLAENLLTATTVHGVLDRVANAARVAVPGADLVSVTLATETGYTTPVYTDDLALKLDEVQYRLGEGPCVEATRTPGLGLTFSGDLAQGVQFPNFGPAAAELGAHCVLAVGLFPEGEKDRFGALNIYAFQAGGLDELDRDVAVDTGRARVDGARGHRRRHLGRAGVRPAATGAAEPRCHRPGQRHPHGAARHLRR